MAKKKVTIYKRPKPKHPAVSKKTPATTVVAVNDDEYLFDPSQPSGYETGRDAASRSAYQMRLRVSQSATAAASVAVQAAADAVKLAAEVAPASAAVAAAATAVAAAAVAAAAVAPVSESLAKKKS